MTRRTSELNIPWLTNIPCHWGVLRSRRLFVARKERALVGDEQLSATQAYGVIPQKEFEQRVGRRVVRITQHLEKRAHVERDDFIISMRSFQGGLERAWARGCIRSSYVVLKPSREAHVGYFSYLFKSASYIRALQSTSNFIRDGQDLSVANFGLVDLPLPPMEEQEAISKVLDKVSKDFEVLIRARRKFIGLVEERRKAIIENAVTCGLNPGAAFKLSSIPAVPQVPAHWEERRFRTIARRIDQGVSPQASGFLAEGNSWGVLKAGCVNHGVFRQTEHKRLPRGFPVDQRIVVRVGDVLVSRACGSPALVGSVAKVGKVDYSLILSDKTFRPIFRDCFNIDFMVLAMNSLYYRRQVEQAISGAEGLANNLPLSELRNFVFAIPPPAEAAAIASATGRELEPLAEAVSRTKRQIALIEELRARMIDDAVTGRLDVRAVAAKLPDASVFASVEVTPSRNELERDFAQEDIGDE